MRLRMPEHAQVYLKKFPGSVAISARTGAGVNELVAALQDELASWRLRSRFLIPLSESGLLAEIHRIGHVLELRYEGDSAIDRGAHSAATRTAPRTVSIE